MSIAISDAEFTGARRVRRAHTRERERGGQRKKEEDGFPFFMEHTRLGVVERLIFQLRKEVIWLKVTSFKTVPQDELSKTLN